MNEKRYVIDTNILLNFPEIMYELDGKVIIPMTVVGELENQKHQSEKPNLKYQARVAIREIKKAVQEEAVEIYTPTTVKKDNFEFLNVYTVMDDLILATVLELNELTGVDHVLMSNDYGMYIKARGLKITNMEYNPESSIDSGYKGFIEVEVEKQVLSALYSFKKIPIGINDNVFPEFREVIEGEPIANAFYEIKVKDSKTRLLTYYDPKQLALIKLGEKDHYNFMGIRPKNKEQMYLSHLLDNDDIPCVQVKAEAGSGKTFMTIAWALTEIESSSHYKKMIYIKTLDPVSGKDIGFLPGEKDDKLQPYLAPLYDSLEIILNQSRDKVKVHLKYMEDRGKFEMEAISHIRGRSFQDTILIIDEAENLDVPTLRTILTRIGEGCKIVILSDDAQIDNPKLSAVTNGTSLMKDSLVGQDLYGFVELQSSVRSKFAGIVNKLMI